MTTDQDQRTAFLHDFDRTFFVEAGAGTGKTTIIVGRIVNLVAAGRVSMDGLAAITFTEAAAAELRDRVREGLERAAESRADPDERDRCARAVGELDLAAIQTIHAFAGGLLRSYPLEAGLPPAFATLDEIERDLAFDDRFRSWFWGTALEPPCRDVLRRALLLGLTEQHLRDLAAALDGQHDLLTAATTWPAATVEDPVTIAHEQGQRLVGLANWLGLAHDGLDDPLAQIVLRALPSARRLLAVTDEATALAALSDLPALALNVGRQPRWGSLPDGRNACTAIKAELKVARDGVVQALDGQRQAIFDAVLELLRDFVLDGVRVRKRDGVATFQDLLAWARDLLRDNPSVRRRARQRFRRLFVDEFQDTDPLQAEIVFYLAGNPDDPLPPDWRDIALAPGKLFVVGDPKQSIYRFRRADIAVYDALLRRLTQARGHLVQNFRSVQPLLDWVNHHFDRVMLAQDGVQPPYVPLAASWAAFDDDVACGVYRVGGDLGKIDAATVARVDAQALAAIVQQMVATATVAEPHASGQRQVRSARYRDVAILLRSRTHLRTLERELERGGVPYRVEGGTLLLYTQDVRDLLACLRAIDDPSDQVALVAALRSPAYACSDPDILRWVEGGGRLSHEDPGDGPDGPVRVALASLADFQTRRLTLAPPALIEAFIADRLLVAAAFDQPRPRETWRRLRYVVARARAFTAQGRHSLRAFLDWVDTLERAAARDADSAAVEADEDAVRIMTVHGAKGLEFPIVLLARLGARAGGRNDAVEVIADRQQGTIACSASQLFRTDGFENAQTREKEMADAEATRLLYVAATRARDHLVLSLFRGERDGGSAAALIEQGLVEYAGACIELPIDNQPAEGSVRLGGAAKDARPLAVDPCASVAEQAWIERRAHIVAALTAPPVLGIPSDALVTTGAMDEDQLVDDPIDTVDGDEGVTASSELSNDVQARIKDHPAYRRAIANPTCRRRVPLLATVDALVVDLTIDLLYQEPGGAVLVLCRSARPTNGSHTDTYAGSVARAFSSATGLPVARVDIIDVAIDHGPLQCW